ncbi:phosphatase domain-containing protein [Aureimonas sp. AU4]|uniref:phosphatase domain-containing protein n=1 Tax=Aureimonas sp. AU4 TaxID=1638163 RepID=UPI0012E3C419
MSRTCSRNSPPAAAERTRTPSSLSCRALEPSRSLQGVQGTARDPARTGVPEGLRTEQDATADGQPPHPRARRRRPHPGRLSGPRFVLVGHTGQSDAAIWSETVRRHPDQTLAVYLRDVSLDGSRSEV